MIATKRCRACEGTGTVPDCDFQPRPCSRCNVTAFNRWADERRPKRPTPTVLPPQPVPPRRPREPAPAHPSLFDGEA